MKKICLSIILLFLASSITLAQNQDDYKNHPGYFNFDKYNAYEKFNTKVQINVKGPLLKLAGAISENKDPELAKLLQKLLLVKVDIFETDKGESKQIQSIISGVSKELKSKKWEQLAYIKEKDEMVEIYLKFQKDILAGIIVMVSESNETVIANIVGEIDLEQIGKLGSKFNIPQLNNIKDIKKEKE